MQKRQSAQASAVVTSTTAKGSCVVEGDSTRTLKKVGASRRSATSKRDHSGRATPTQPAYTGASSASNRKRSHQDASDENADQKPRVRQRLISKASVETIRASTTHAHAPTHKTTPEADEAHSPSRRPLLREPSARNLRATGPQPLTESSVNMQSASPRTLRRVGTFSFSSLDKRDIFDDEEERQRTNAPSRSRIPVPTSRASTSEARQLQRRHSEVDLFTIFERPPRHMQQPKPCSTKDPRETLVEEAILRKISRPLPAVPQTTSSSTRAGLDRYDLKLALMDKHVELWDQSDECVCKPAIERA
ncbi:hypothetical protein EWM64_g3432 [Hericium alpestre]|uniref:Uncharacterized protein n=1 Tax=Hericium alpestre TaxID=135208 RepID=A0A4Z0A2Y8_9AGAM|nr:hypothetical protein EWM64_g3432 [Hericium alpestre]